MTAAEQVSTARAPRLERVSWALLLVVLGAALVLRFIGLDHLPGVNADEAVFPVHAAEWRAGVPLSELRTGTDLPMNPVFFGVVALLNALLPASFWTLRLAALVHSLLSVGLGFWLFRKRGRLFATLFATLLAVLPIQLGYARLAWDPSAVSTVVVLALAAATRGRLLATALGFGLCLWVHPSTVFVAPVLLAAAVVARWPRARDGALRQPGRRALTLLLLGVVAALLVVVAVFHYDALPTPVLAALRKGLLEQARARLTDGSAALSFVRLYAELIAGPTVYRYVVGSMPSLAALLHVAAAALVYIAVVLVLLWRLPAERRAADRALGLGLLASLALAYVIGGLPVLTPHTERYGMFLVAPTCYVLAACLEAVARTPFAAAGARLGVAAAGALSLASFTLYFLMPLRHFDPERHNTFRTGELEPKQGAWQVIERLRAPDRVTLVRVEDWWIYWPLRYLMGERADARVTIAGARWNFRFPRDFIEPELPPEATQVFRVAWVGSSAERKLSSGAEASVDIPGFAGEPILRVYRLPLAQAASPAAH